MNHKLTKFSIIALSILLTLAGSATAQDSESGAAIPLGTSFTYQGRLSQGGAPANGAFDFEFYIFDTPGGGTQIGGPISVDDFILSDGYFTVLLDFGTGAFSGQARYLEVRVRPGSDPGSFTTLIPRQELTATPNALFAQSTPWSGLNGIPTGFADNIDNDTHYTAGHGLTLSGVQFSADTGVIQERVAGICASGSSIRVINSDGTVTCETDNDTTSFWSLSGNSGTNPATDYLGTRDNAAFELRVYGDRALRLEPNPLGPNLIGGYKLNWVANGVRGAALFGGGDYHLSFPNRVTDNFGTVSGGGENLAGNDNGNVDDAEFATIGGGYANRAVKRGATVSGGGSNVTSNSYTTVSGGILNTASGSNASVGGGDSNTSSGDGATVSGGESNTASGIDATVSGGGNNNASSSYAAISGGYGNIANNSYATVGGGDSNSASGDTATVCGGSINVATGNFATVCGGFYNQAINAYATVGGGYSNGTGGGQATVGGGAFNSASGDTATVCGGLRNTASSSWSAIGGGRSNEASGSYATVPGGSENVASGDYSFAAGAYAHATHSGAFVWSSGLSYGESTDSYDDNTFTVRAHGGVRFYTASGTATGVILDAGSGSWSSLSDRASKGNLVLVNNQELLERLAGVPIANWNYLSQDASVRHIGPMAQDFYAAFGVGEDEKYISNIDAEGVALAAIQGLYQRSQNQSIRIETLKTENALLKERLTNVETRLAALERGGSTVIAQPISTWLLLAGLGFSTVIAWRRKADRS